MRKLLYILAISLVGCGSQQQRVARAYALLSKNQRELAGFCGNSFPITERLIRGTEILKIDTIRLAGDSLHCSSQSLFAPIKVRCPDQQIIRKTIFRTDTLERENTAKIVSLNLQLAKDQSKLESAETQRDGYKKRSNQLMLLSGGLGFLMLIAAILRWKLK